MNPYDTSAADSSEHVGNMHLSLTNAQQRLSADLELEKAAFCAVAVD